jgi:hypothetical protein
MISVGPPPGTVIKPPLLYKPMEIPSVHETKQKKEVIIKEAIQKPVEKYKDKPKFSSIDNTTHHIT